MEPMGGLDLLRTVRADPDLKATPFILTTASRAPDIVFAAKRLGADHYLLKPFTPKQLAEKIEIILRRNASPGCCRTRRTGRRAAASTRVAERAERPGDLFCARPIASGTLCSTLGSRRSESLIVRQRR